MNPFLGQLMLVGFNYAPVGWALCNGQLLPISQYAALFSLLGTFYGGDGVNTFGLPNLESRVVIGMGQGVGLSYYPLGQLGGAQTATLSVENMPAHNHAFNVASDKATFPFPAGKTLGGNPDDLLYAHLQARPVQMNTGVIGDTGGGQPFSIIPPYIAMTWIIALEGVFPTHG